MDSCEEVSSGFFRSGLRWLGFARLSGGSQADCRARRRWRESWSSIRRATARALPPRRFFGRAGAMLMRAHDGCVDHRVFVVRIIGQSFEKTLPNAFFRPARKPRVDVLPGSKPLRKIPPRRARAELPDHRFDEQAIAHIAVAPNAPGTPRKQSFNPRKLVVTQSIPSHRKPPKMKAPHESRFQRFANPLSSIEDTP